MMTRACLESSRARSTPDRAVAGSTNVRAGPSGHLAGDRGPPLWSSIGSTIEPQIGSQALRIGAVMADYLPLRRSPTVTIDGTRYTIIRTGTVNPRGFAYVVLMSHRTHRRTTHYMEVCW